jgi:fructose-1,6-bisphosphatase/inositol monophosphatase family enzyme
LIALLDRGEPSLGIIDSPRLGERYVGNGERSWCETQSGTTELRCSGRTELSNARVSTTDPFLFGETGAFAALQAQTQTARYGLDAYAYARLAAGTLDLVVECGLKPHDYNALIPVVRGAGGVFGDWSGGTDLADGNVIAAATEQLYEAAVAVMSGPRGVAEGPR